MSVFMIDPEKIKTFPDSFLEYFLEQESVSEVTKVLIREVLKGRRKELRR